MDTHTDQDGHGRIEKFFFLLRSNVPDEGYQNYIRWKLCRGYLAQKKCYISERVFGSFSLHFLSESRLNQRTPYLLSVHHTFFSFFFSFFNSEISASGFGNFRIWIRKFLWPIRKFRDRFRFFLYVEIPY